MGPDRASGAGHPRARKWWSGASVRPPWVCDRVAGLGTPRLPRLITMKLQEGPRCGVVAERAWRCWGPTSARIVAGPAEKEGPLDGRSGRLRAAVS
ncbi:hypothetical protein NDU88_008537 [Pleurodeles waltl]|uniref:Uncharacterized protein n=1 Tax=Pleurodeles waltl TaxID=8319 RepID=A0AAV7NZ91_PLEWA|nr:hypothetical protein NDU88_008537 [Pleurodeles waltl]